MKIFTKKSFTNKFIISIICITLLSFCTAPFVSPVKAADDDVFGGKMMGMVRDFVRDVADVAASLVQFGLTGEWIYAVDEKGSGTPDNPDEYWIKQEKFRYPKLQISPEVIFANQVEMLDVNFISSNAGKTYLLELRDNGPLETLRRIVAGWYVTLRTIAVVGLLSVLIYVGIRIIISSTSADKAKYKQRLVDWLVAFCLLFFMHYIMAAAVTVVEQVNNMLTDVVNLNEGIPLQSKYGGVRYQKVVTDTDGYEGDLGGGHEQNIKDFETTLDSADEVTQQDNKEIQEIKNSMSGSPTSESSWVYKGTETPSEGGTMDVYNYTISYGNTTFTIIKRDRQTMRKTQCKLYCY